MTSCLFPIVLGIAVFSLGPILAFKSVDFAKFPETRFQDKQRGSPQMENKMKELQEQFGAAVKSENNTKEEVVAVKSKVEELTKLVEGSEEAAAKTQEKVKEMSERMMNFEASIAKAEMLKSSVDNAVQIAETHKIDIAELKASKVNMNAKLTNLGETLGNVSKELSGIKKEVKEELETGRQFIEQSDAASGPGPDGGTAQIEDCPLPFTLIERSGQCLMVSNDKAANVLNGCKQCMDFNSRSSLAILDTEEKLIGAKEYLTNKGINADVLVGGSKQSDKYMWVNDKEIDLTKGWCQDQPFDGRGCVSLWQGKGFCLDDSFCDYKFYLCEIRPGVEYDYDG